MEWADGVMRMVGRYLGGEGGELYSRMMGGMSSIIFWIDSNTANGVEIGWNTGDVGSVHTVWLQHSSCYGEAGPPCVGRHPPPQHNSMPCETSSQHNSMV